MAECTSARRTAKKVEQAVFRRLNAVVEPLLRRGVGSSAAVPASLVLLETTGYISGQVRSTPLWSVRLGPYRLVSTARGRRSFWVKNLQKAPEARVIVGGKEQDADAIVVTPDFDNTDDWDVTPELRRLLTALQRTARQGWAFALLVPAAG